MDQTRKIIDGEMPKGDRFGHWQIVPEELPADLTPMALELWQTESGELHLFQFMVEDRNSSTWYNEVRGFLHFVQKEG